MSRMFELYHKPNESTNFYPRVEGKEDELFFKIDGELADKLDTIFTIFELSEKDSYAIYDNKEGKCVSVRWFFENDEYQTTNFHTNFLGILFKVSHQVKREEPKEWFYAYLKEAFAHIEKEMFKEVVNN